MNLKDFYSEIYRITEKVTPLPVDCGKLCDGSCCKGDEDTGMYLFPGEKVMYKATPSWAKIRKCGFTFGGEKVDFISCDGTCDRSLRPLACRIFPLFADENNKIIPDMRAKAVCPLVAAKISLGQYDQVFIRNVKRVFNMLNNVRETKEYLAKTREIIKEYDVLNDIFSV